MKDWATNGDMIPGTTTQADRTVLRLA